jgi:hypothetical protein
VKDMVQATTAPVETATRSPGEAEHEGLMVAEAIVYLRELFQRAPYLATSETAVPGCGPVTWAHLAALQRFSDFHYEMSAPKDR